MSIDFYVPTDRKETSMNLNNANAHTLLLALGYDNPEAAGTLEPDDVIARVARVQREIEAGRGEEFTRTGDINTKPNQNVFDFGLDLPHLKARVRWIGELAEIAKKLNQKVYYG